MIILIYIKFSKQEIIANIYYDKGGFGSKAITLKDARAKDKTITMQDVEDFSERMLKSKESKEVKTLS